MQNCSIYVLLRCLSCNCFFHSRCMLHQEILCSCYCVIVQSWVSVLVNQSLFKVRLYVPNSRDFRSICLSGELAPPDIIDSISKPFIWQVQRYNIHCPCMFNSLIPLFENAFSLILSITSTREMMSPPVTFCCHKKNQRAIASAVNYYWLTAIGLPATIP